MTSNVQTQFISDLLELLKETFEGPAPSGPSAFLNKGTGVCDNVRFNGEYEWNAKGGVSIGRTTTHEAGMLLDG